MNETKCDDCEYWICANDMKYCCVCSAFVGDNHCRFFKQHK